MTRRIADFAAGLAALVALAAVMVLPPLLLTRFVGWPLPDRVPGFGDLENSVRTGIDPYVIVKTLAVIAWIAWAQVAATVLVEIVALLRRHSAPNLRVLPGLQPVIGRLVATAALAVTALLPTASATIAVAAGPPPAAAAFAAYRAPATVGLPAQSPDTSPPTDTAAAAPMASVEVRRHDSLWAIAERALGDGTRWREIRDANLGRQMPDGTVITASTELIRPGWVLYLPTTLQTPPQAPVAEPNPTAGPAGPAAPVAEPAEATQPAAQVTTVTVAFGDNLWKLAERQLTDMHGRPPTEGETVAYWRELIATNRHLLPTGDPDLIYPGEQFALPPVDGPTSPAPPTDPPAPDVVAEPASSAPDLDERPEPASSTTTPPPPPTTAVATPATSVTAAPQPAAAESTRATTAPAAESTTSPPASESDVDTDDEALGPVARAGLLGVAATGLGVGITRTLRRRRRRDAHQHPGRLPTAEHTDVQRDALLAADDDRADALHAALDQLARGLGNAGATARPRIVQHDDDHLDVLLTQPATPAVDGWTAEANGAIWTWNRTTPNVRLGDLRSPAPLLVTLGRPDDDGGQLHLDLEADTLVSLVGDQSTALAVARSIATELAYSPTADRVNLVLVGDLGADAAARLDRIMVTDTWDDVLVDLTVWSEQSHRVHADHGWPTSFAARVDHDHDALSPLVVIAQHPPPSTDALTGLATQTPSAVAVVVVGGELPTGTVVDCQPDQLVIRDLGLVCQPQGLTADTVRQIADLLEPEHASEPDSAPLDHDELPPTSGRADLRLVTAAHNETAPADHALDVAAGDDDGEPYQDRPAEIVVRLLGDITVSGGAQPLTPKQTAVVVYIALTPGVSGDRLEDALWAAPTGGSRRKRLANILSDCRRVLGSRHLPPAADSRYTVAATVATDLELFDRRVAVASSQAPHAAVVTLQGALDLVRGPVFTYRAADRWSFTWVDLENWVSRWEPKVAAVAQHLAELCLDQHDPAGAIDAATRALGIVPTHVGLTETLMRAHAANGDPTSVDAVYQAHANALEQLDLDDVADSTHDLYDELRRSKVTSDAWAPVSKRGVKKTLGQSRPGS